MPQTRFRFLAHAINWLRGSRWDARAEARKQIARMVELRGDPQPELSKAIGDDDVAGVLALLKAGLNPNATDRQGETPLMFAAYRGRTEVVRILLQSGAEPNHQSLDGNTALHMAVDDAVDRVSQAGGRPGAERLGTIQALLEAGASIELENQRGDTAVEWARGSEKVRALLSSFR